MPYRPGALFELGDSWIAHEHGTPLLYRFWRDKGRGRTRRASLGTADLEQAKLKLAQIVVQGAPASIDTPLSVVLLNYFRDRTDALPSKKTARTAGRHFRDCWGETFRVGAITEAKQREFAEWSIRDKGHALASIARNLGVLAAACAHAKLDVDVMYGEEQIRQAWGLRVKAKRRTFIPSDDELARLWAADMPENLRRWIWLAMGTGGRPTAALELSPAARRRDAGLLDLLPEGRVQNKKVRPVVREPKVLSKALDGWEAKGLDPHGGKYCGYSSRYSVRQALERVCAEAAVDLPHLTAKSFRHKAITILRSARVPEDQIALQVGHKRPHVRTTGLYGEWGPDYLIDAAAALDAWIRRVQRLAKEATRKRTAGAKESQASPKPQRGERKKAA